MALERRNPLPPGRYWQDFFGENVELATKYFQDNAGSTYVEASEGDDGPDGKWILFKVMEPTAWNALRFGFPTIAGAGIRTRRDTVSGRETPEKNPLEKLEETRQKMNEAIDAAKEAATSGGDAAKAAGSAIPGVADTARLAVLGGLGIFGVYLVAKRARR